MAEAGSATCGCGEALVDETFAQPLDEARHEQCAIKLLSVKEKGNEGTEYLGGGSEIFVKGLMDELVIKYEVKVCSMSVTLWLEFDPGNKVHAEFYKAYEGEGVTGSRVVVIVGGESKAPGIHEALWDGRDKTKDRRILLDGTWKLRIQGLHDATPTDAGVIRIMPPLSWNFGIHYPGNTTKKEVEKACDVQYKLADGTAFSPSASCSEVASIAWASLKSSAVGVVSGHSNPVLLAFYPEESKPGKAVSFKKVKQSYIMTRERPDPPPKPPKADIDNTVFMPEEPADACRDVFLMVLAGCRGGNEVYLIQDKLKKLSRAFNPGAIDRAHGPKTTAALKAWQGWEGIEPADGTKNEATLVKLGIDSTLDEKAQTGEVQSQLKAFSRRYDPGTVDGLWDSQIETAIANYQQDHAPPLEVTSLPDTATAVHLRATAIGDARNIAEAFVHRGCNIAFAFVKKVSFKGAEKWHIHFWDLAAQGVGIDDAALQARTMTGAVHMKELDYSIYTRNGIDKNSAVHPARHGADM